MRRNELVELEGNASFMQMGLRVVTSIEIIACAFAASAENPAGLGPMEGIRRDECGIIRLAGTRM